MFQFPAFPSRILCIHIRVPDFFKSGGFPHSDICGSMAICAFPQLFAAYRVLLRLPVPRHSPYALSSLTYGHSSSFITLVSPCLFKLPLVTLLTSFSYIIQFSMCSRYDLVIPFPSGITLLYHWWAQMESNHRPHAYQACALNHLSYRPPSTLFSASYILLFILYFVNQYLPETPAGKPWFEKRLFFGLGGARKDPLPRVVSP